MSIISVSTPKTPASYPASVQDALYLLKTFNRISYKAANGGVDAPEYDEHRDVKLWLDTAARSGHTTYQTLATDAQGAFETDPPHFVPLYLPVVIAASVNLPPDPNAHFPTWDPPASDAVIISGGVPVSGVDRFELSTEVQADDLYVEFKEFTSGGVYLWTPTPGPGGIHVQYGNDPRRKWQFLFKQQVVMVGDLLKDMYGPLGVGAPGSWDLAGPEPIWIPHPAPPLPSSFKVTPVPMRHLHSDETWDVLPVGGLMVGKK